MAVHMGISILITQEVFYSLTHEYIAQFFLMISSCFFTPENEYRDFAKFTSLDCYWLVLVEYLFEYTYLRDHREMK